MLCIDDDFWLYFLSALAFFSKAFPPSVNSIYCNIRLLSIALLRTRIFLRSSEARLVLGRKGKSDIIIIVVGESIIWSINGWINCLRLLNKRNLKLSLSLFCSAFSARCCFEYEDFFKNNQNNHRNTLTMLFFFCSSSLGRVVIVSGIYLSYQRDKNDAFSEWNMRKLLMPRGLCSRWQKISQTLPFLFWSWPHGRLRI